MNARLSAILLSATLMTLGAGAHADSAQQTEAKIRLARKVLIKGSITPFATPELKRLVAQSDKVQHKIDPEGPACEEFEHYYLGYGNGDSEGNQLQQLKITPKADGRIHASYRYYGKERKNIVFDMVCKGISCQIRDVVHNGSSFKRAHEYIVKNKACLI